MEDRQTQKKSLNKNNLFFFSTSLIFEENIDKLWPFLRDLNNEIKVIDYLENMRYVSGNNTYNKDNIFSYNWIGLTQLTVKCLFIEISNNKKVIKWECTGDIGINFFRAYYLYRITENDKTLVKVVVFRIEKENELIDYKPSKNYFSNLEFKILADKKNYFQNLKEDIIKYESCIINQNYLKVRKYFLDTKIINKIHSTIGESIEFNEENLRVGSFLKIYIGESKKTFFMRISEMKNPKKFKTWQITFETIGSNNNDFPKLVQFKLVIIDNCKTQFSILIIFRANVQENYLKKYEKNTKVFFKNFRQFIQETNEYDKEIMKI